MRVCLVILACCVGYIAYCMANISLPEGMSNQWELRVLFTVYNFLTFISKVGGSVGIWDRWKTFRGIDNWQAVNLAPNRNSSLQVTDTQFDGVNVRVYIPEGEKKTRPALVFYHGGGWTFGSVATYDYVVGPLASQSDAVLVSVDYRLAPEHPFPIPFEDAVKAASYFLENANKYNVDSKRIALMGDSAGGNLAAAVSLKLRGKYEVKLQVLIYPILQAIDILTPSYQSATDPITTAEGSAEVVLNYALGNSWNKADVQDFLTNNHTSPEIKKKYFSTYVSHSNIPKDWFADGYQKNKDDFGNVVLWKRLEKALLDPYFCPLLADDLSGLPEAYVLTVHVDAIRDDGVLYVKRLQDANVKVTHVHLRHGIHGMMNLDFVDSSKALLSDIADFIKKTL